MEYYIRNGAIRWKISKSIKEITHFCASFTISELLAFQISDLDNLGQGHRVQHLQLCHSMVNINLYKSHNIHLC